MLLQIMLLLLLADLGQVKGGYGGFKMSYQYVRITVV
jgi:hypothetical protein